MAKSEWRDRLIEAVNADGRSMQDISLAAGLSHGYVHGILKDGKEPTLDRFLRICSEVGISYSQALMGADMTPEAERLLELASKSPEKAAQLVALLSD